MSKKVKSHKKSAEKIKEPEVVAPPVTPAPPKIPDKPKNWVVTERTVEGLPNDIKGTVHFSTQETDTRAKAPGHHALYDAATRRRNELRDELTKLFYKYQPSRFVFAFEIDVKPPKDMPYATDLLPSVSSMRFRGDIEMTAIMAAELSGRISGHYMSHLQRRMQEDVQRAADHTVKMGFGRANANKNDEDFEEIPKI